MRHTRSSAVIGVVSVGLAACAPLEEPASASGSAAPPEVTTPVKRLSVDLDVDLPADADVELRTLTLSLEDQVVWSCAVGAEPRARARHGPVCESNDVWFRGPGLYTFTLDDQFAADVFLHEDVTRLQLDADGYQGEANELRWHVAVRAFIDGNDLAALKTGEDLDVQFANLSGMQVLKESMTAALERWDSVTSSWRDVARAPIFLCGTGWNPRVRENESEDIYMPWFAQEKPRDDDESGSRFYRLRFPFRVDGEDEERLATVITEIEDERFGRRSRRGGE